MFDFLKRKKNTDTADSPNPVETGIAPAGEDIRNKPGLFARLKQGLSKTRATLATGMANLFLGKKEISQDLLNDIEMALLTADVGVETTDQLIQALTRKLARKELNDAQTAFHFLQEEMKQILRPCAVPLSIAPETRPFVILVVGINGSGKTTTIGKLASHFKQQGKHIMLAAGDTFRAAAIEQLQVWGSRNQVPVIAQQPGADTAAVIFDAMEAAKARGADILIADTAGRLHTQSNLMAELQKVKRVLAKTDSSAPHETLIVLDASLGQNALNQVKQFNEAMGVTGIVLTKLDGTAKGGIIFAIANQTKIPIRFIGIGEGIQDLRPFDADDFVNALFAGESSQPAPSA
ncbi:Signal recognition particle receptor FtsY [Aquicella siphonis]|uniref:Signal recognition particle receptor FtsY n=1 Tax=Aquicella siphonis TaxID=254247 RepID=A0A5E4PFC9_9COXI|nr:signal recognition particle-docking protein FtsY [Aquicella siphonis]VVC75061.1 Signal recognition particle receptor FtsY [Aquicella siphonis]